MDWKGSVRFHLWLPLRLILFVTMLPILCGSHFFPLRMLGEATASMNDIRFFYWC